MANGVLLLTTANVFMCVNVIFMYSINILCFKGSIVAPLKTKAFFFLLKKPKAKEGTQASVVAETEFYTSLENLNWV